jgi:uncharacterized protein (DUF1501 family)
MDRDDEIFEGCGSSVHFSRRTLLRMAGLSGLSWLTPLATGLARQAEQQKSAGAKSVILLWLEGAPSQLETFDPHPGTEIAYGSQARKTNVPGIRLGEGFEQLAEQMDAVSLIRAITSEEGDHERAIYNIKTGFRPDPTLIHPAIGGIICHQLQAVDSQVVDIPRHVSILPGGFPARGGYLGDQFDAFRIGDPVNPVPDMKPTVANNRQQQRLQDLEQINQHFARGRQRPSQNTNPFGTANIDAAIRMMSSEQLEAFDVSKLPISEQLKYGDTPFGRGCLAAFRLIQAGVRCVEVTLGGWDTHVDNHNLQAGRIKILDPAFASLIADLREHDLLDSTLVLCGGEFGRTPWLNPLGGRDHWPHGFSLAIAGGGIQGGRVVGETNPAPKRETKDRHSDLKNARPLHDVHATIFDLMGIDYSDELMTPIGRPLAICEGHPIRELYR